MGIDVYNQTAQQKNGGDSGNGFDTLAGDKGYLREAYHSETYATHHLVKECFGIEHKETEGNGVHYHTKVYIPAKVLQARLPKTLELVRERYKTTYKAKDDEIKEAQKSFIDFVELAEKLEKESEYKSACEIYASY